jgi:hypothetical protein
MIMIREPDPEPEEGKSAIKTGRCWAELPSSGQLELKVNSKSIFSPYILLPVIARQVSVLASASWISPA